MIRCLNRGAGHGEMEILERNLQPGFGLPGGVRVHRVRKDKTMRFLLLLVGWCLLLVLCWPLALLVLVLAPVVWLVLLPFRLVGITVDAVFSFLHAVLLLPARLLGYRPRSRA